MPKVYIAGKVTGIDIDVAKNNFDLAENKLINQGYQVINPIKLPHDHDKNWESYMKECISELLKCDFIYMIDGWQSSKGACIEYFISQKLKINRIFENNN